MSPPYDLPHDPEDDRALMPRDLIIPQVGTYWVHMDTGTIVRFIGMKDEFYTHFDTVWVPPFLKLSRIDSLDRILSRDSHLGGWSPNTDYHDRTYFEPLDPVLVGRFWTQAQDFIRTYADDLREQADD